MLATGGRPGPPRHLLQHPHAALVLYGTPPVHDFRDQQSRGIRRRARGLPLRVRSAFGGGLRGARDKTYCRDLEACDFCAFESWVGHCMVRAIVPPNLWQLWISPLEDAQVSLMKVEAKGSTPHLHRRGRDDRLSESPFYAVEQDPGTLVGHSHVARRGRNKTCIADAFPARLLCRGEIHAPESKWIESLIPAS
jgi:hypothetical protein